MRTEIREVTPALAQEWLDGKAPNRGLKPYRIAAYAAPMKAGRWRLTHQGIAFNEHGQLVDGQHRLTAIVQTGVTVTMICTWGLDKLAIANMDQPAPRSVSDNCRVATGESVHQSVVSLCNAMRRGMRFAAKAGQRGSALSTEEFLSWREQHMEAVAFAAGLIGTGKKTRGIGRADVGAVLARAFYHDDPARIREFFTIVASPNLALDSAEPGAGAAILLNQYLVGSKVAVYNSASARTTYAKTARALKAFLDGRPLDKLYAATTELFPLPGETS